MMWRVDDGCMQLPISLVCHVWVHYQRFRALRQQLDGFMLLRRFQSM